jgi:cell division protein FtsI (penicillin-binding protein 3)
MLEEPSAGGYYGGIAAAPIFSAITSNTLRILNVLPDKIAHQFALHQEHKKNLKVIAVTPSQERIQ